ncbi:alpha/beta fold hydrolase [[Mycoplasma] gypis]|uniref:Alpha/beta fold hydrolase n=1 Tax=[Mycoplasma] gypis TaxID=92404 RepID=A0ABZ2RS17_9BACT|nr:alpha/beta fold hydrolase [[Mycoplasma] gypis]MBN0919592.1 alpha/beta fold hydrolase [[Mycoplasma] gypis]
MQKTISLLNEEINYFIENENDTTKPFVLFIHGFGDSLNIMRPIERQENRNFNIVSLDMPGCGRSTWNQQITLEHYQEIALEFVNKVLKDKTFYVVGHSLGAISTLYVLKNTHAKKGLLVAPAHYVSTMPKFIFGKKYLIPENEQNALESYMLLSYKNIETMKRSASTYAKLVLDPNTKRKEKFGFMVNEQMLNPNYIIPKYWDLYSSVNNYEIASGDQDHYTNIHEVLLVGYQNNKKVHVLKDTGHSAFFDSGDEINEIIINMIKNN